MSAEPSRGRYASPQAWRRLRKHLSSAELRDIAADIAGEIGETSDPAAITADVHHALTAVPWDRRHQL